MSVCYKNLSFLGYRKYRVGNDGSIWSKARNWSDGKWRKLKPGMDADGYLHIELWKNGNRRLIKVHRLILTAFVGDFPDKQVNHKNGNRSDNRLSNLEWTTCSENAIHAFRILQRTILRGEAHGSSKLTNKQADAIRELLDKGELSQSAIGRMFGVSQTTVWEIKVGRTRAKQYQS